MKIPPDMVRESERCGYRVRGDRGIQGNIYIYIYIYIYIERESDGGRERQTKSG